MTTLTSTPRRRSRRLERIVLPLAVKAAASGLAILALAFIPQPLDPSATLLAVIGAAGLVAVAAPVRLRHRRRP